MIGVKNGRWQFGQKKIRLESTILTKIVDFGVIWAGYLATTLDQNGCVREKPFCRKWGGGPNVTCAPPI